MNLNFLIVTGISGAGKRSVMKMLEDANYYCVDNIPLKMLSDFVELEEEEYKDEYKNIAIGLDVRIGKEFEDFAASIEKLRNNEKYSLQVLFLECNDEVLIHRYKETRRNHPLTQHAGNVKDAIELERKILSKVKEKADYILDTSQLLVRELKAQVYKIFIDNNSFGNFVTTVCSFGFKYGIPLDADIVMDVRFLPNPYYVEALKEKTGMDEGVKAFVKAGDSFEPFMDKLTDMITFLIPNYVAEGKNQIVIAIGCTGGKHRSVTVANELYKRLTINDEYLTRLEHRDIEK
ncbi:MAG: RNase adapter RapZ [Lachnospiraceae bacterium]|nr:RNase adapter RapZ [Lachnospiraceae bacterium]